MKTLAIRYTRPDRCTVPGGIILRVHEDRFGPGQHEYIAHSFSRERGSKEPTSFFWGRYCRTEEAGRRAFSDKVDRAAQYNSGGSLISDIWLNDELKKELEQVEA
jgi:hypothetical protein